VVSAEIVFRCICPCQSSAIERGVMSRISGKASAAMLAQAEGGKEGFQRRGSPDNSGTSAVPLLCRREEEWRGPFYIQVEPCNLVERLKPSQLESPPCWAPSPMRNTLCPSWRPPWQGTPFAPLYEVEGLCIQDTSKYHQVLPDTARRKWSSVNWIASLACGLVCNTPSSLTRSFSLMRILLLIRVP